MIATHEVSVSAAAGVTADLPRSSDELDDTEGLAGVTSELWSASKGWDALLLAVAAAVVAVVVVVVIGASDGL